MKLIVLTLHRSNPQRKDSRAAGRNDPGVNSCQGQPLVYLSKRRGARGRAPHGSDQTDVALALARWQDRRQPCLCQVLGQSVGQAVFEEGSHTQVLQTDSGGSNDTPLKTPCKMVCYKGRGCMEARRLLGTNFTGPGPKGPCGFFFFFF